QIEVCMPANRDQFFRCGSDYENISFLQNLVSDRAANSLSLANETSHGEVVIFVALNVANCLANKRRIRRHGNLGQVIFQPKVSSWIVTSLMRRQQKSPQPQNEQGTRDGQTQSDGGNRKN